jgi:hypothetical protein
MLFNLSIIISYAMHNAVLLSALYIFVKAAIALSGQAVCLQGNCL